MVRPDGRSIRLAFYRAGSTLIANGSRKNLERLQGICEPNERHFNAAGPYANRRPIVRPSSAVH